MITREDFKQIRKIAKEYKVRIYWTKNNESYTYGVTSRSKKGLITISLYGKDDRDILLSLLFHEIGHVYCIRNNLWNSYHLVENKRLFKLTALKAERWVDKWANREFNKFFPEKKYYSSYTDPLNVKWFKEVYYKNMFK